MRRLMPTAFHTPERGRGADRRIAQIDHPTPRGRHRSAMAVVSSSVR